MQKQSNSHSISRSPLAILTTIVFFVLWLLLLYTVLHGSSSPVLKSSVSTKRLTTANQENTDGLVPAGRKELKLPRRYVLPEDRLPPPPLDEIKRNLTSYLHTLHRRILDLAGPKVDALSVWDAYFDVTKNMIMKWDDENRNRFPTPRDDGSIFVSLGTYRGM